jgi:hypothetical protein
MTVQWKARTSISTWIFVFNTISMVVYALPELPALAWFCFSILVWEHDGLKSNA